MVQLLTIKMLMHVKNQQLYYSVLDDPWTNGVTNGEQKIELSLVCP